MTATIHERHMTPHVAAPTPARSVITVAKRARVDQRRAPLTWGGPLGAMCALMVAIYPSIEEALRKAIDTYPDGLKEAFRIEEINSVAAYLDTEMFSFLVPLAVAVFAIRCVSRALAGAEEARFLDVVLSAPLRRRDLVAGVFAATAASLVLVLLVVGAAAWISSVIAGAGLALQDAAAGVASVWPLGIFFAGLATALAGVAHRSGVVTGVAAGVLVAMYVMDLVGKLADSVSWLRYGSVFRYYGVALRDGIEPIAFGGLTIAGVLLALLGASLFERRDISG